jgi:hypothetical protein
MTPVGFEPTISESERPQTYALDGAATGIGGPHTLRLWNNRGMHWIGGWVGPRACVNVSEEMIFSLPAYEPLIIRPVAQSIYRQRVNL